MLKLVITEKPSVAQSIAKVLSATKHCNGYLEGNGYLISWCVGHLVELAPPDHYDERYKKWKKEDLPILPANWKYTVSPGTKKQFNILKELMNRDDVESLICATDAGREGELIFRLVYHQCRCRKPFERLWISSMEDSAIREGFRHLKPGTEYDALYEAALCRERSDWIVGINATRLFSVLYGNTLNVGRVMSPTLALTVMREAAIAAFISEPFYTVKIQMDGFTASSERIESKEEAEKLAADCKEASAVVTKVERKNRKEKPPLLYDLTTLQREANKIRGYTAQQTLDYAQSLYEKKLVTYPRTDARVLSTAVAKEITRNLNGLSKYEMAAPYLQDILSFGSYKNLAKTRYVNDKQITDHYAIIPTGQGLPALKSVSATAHKVYDLIVRRFLSIFYPAAVYQKVSIVSKMREESFFSSFKVLAEEGYLKVAGMPQSKDQAPDTDLFDAIKTLRKGAVLPVQSLDIKEGETSPPKRYNSGSIILAMENAGQLIEDEELRAQIKGSGIGTSATRAEILKKLIHIKYLALNKKTQIITPTLQGEMVYDVVDNSIRSLLNPELTASWEKGLTYVAEGSITSDEYMKKLDDFITRRTVGVKGLNNQYQLRACYDKAAGFYKKGRKTGGKEE